MKKILIVMLILVLILAFSLTTYAETIYYPRGDADLNEKLSISDATILQLSLAKLITLEKVSTIVGDADKDGVISIADVTMIQQALAIIVNLGDKVPIVIEEQGWGPVVKP